MNNSFSKKISFLATSVVIANSLAFASAAEISDTNAPDTSIISTDSGTLTGSGNEVLTQEASSGSNVDTVSDSNSGSVSNVDTVSDSNSGSVSTPDSDIVQPVTTSDGGGIADPISETDVPNETSSVIDPTQSEISSDENIDSKIDSTMDDISSMLQEIN